ncbi:MAG TPA: ROK family protein [Micromonospora sp.]|nr:ROK family protein [Micromonospora sp.]
MSGIGAFTDSDVVIGLDVGGTKIAGGLVDGAGRVRDRMLRPTRRDNPDDTVRELVGELLARARERSWRVRAVGAGYPEYVSPDGLLTSTEVLSWSQQPADLLRELCPTVPIVVESDVRAGATAEATWGAARQLPSFFYVSLGTGLSCALVLSGRAMPGTRGEALALGECEVPNRPLSAFPNALAEATRGNLEAFVSGDGIARRYTERTGRQVDEAAPVVSASETDPVAREILTTAGIALGTVLGSMVAVLDPAAVVLGGGLGCADGLLSDTIGETFARTTSRRPNGPPLLRAAGRDDAGLLGAAALAAATAR